MTASIAMNSLEINEQNQRVTTVLGSLVAGCALIGALTFALPAPASDAGRIYLSALLLDRGSSIYPLTIQNVMWLMFCFGLGELWVRFRRANAELEQLAKGILMEDQGTMYRAKDLIPVYRRVMRVKHERYFRLQRVIRRIVQQFQISRSIDQANSLMNSSLELMQHEIELKYNMLRYLVWLIPTLGFIGTVVGIALALSAAGDMPDLDIASEVQAWFAMMTTKLGVAFNTTLLALLMAAVLVFLLHIAQGKEEMALNNAGQYCLDYLVNRLYEE